MCPRNGAEPDDTPPAVRDMDLTLGKFFFYAATHPKYAATRRFDFSGWQFLPDTCGAEGWFRVRPAPRKCRLRKTGSRPSSGGRPRRSARV